MANISPSHMLLLKAALLQGEESLTAWAQWRRHYDLDLVDPDAYRLLPQVYKNLKAQGIEENYLKKLKGIYRHTWCKNRLVMKQCLPLILCLRKSGVLPLLLNEASRVFSGGSELSTYPLDKVDIAVSIHQGPLAIQCLQKTGWSSWSWNPSHTLTQEGSVLFRNQDNRLCHLHEQVLEHYIHPKANDYFWERLEPVNWEGETISILTPTASLFKCLIDGDSQQKGVTPRWIMDVYLMITSHSIHISWDEILIQGKALTLTYPLKHHVSCLLDILNPGLSLGLQEKFTTLPATKMEKLEYQAKTTQPLGKEGLVSRLAMHWCQYIRTEEPKNFIPALRGFVEYLRKLWNIQHLWQLPFLGMFRSARRIVREGLV